MQAGPRSLYAILALSLSVAVLVGGCRSTRHLNLKPEVPPVNATPLGTFGSLEVEGFANRIEDERGFFEERKRFQNPLVDTFDHALLTALKDSGAFDRVYLGRYVDGVPYRVTGEVLRLDAHTDWNPFSPDVIAACTTHFRLLALDSQETLLEGTVITEGIGEERYHRGWQADDASYGGDATYGYEQSLSVAIARNVAEIRDRVLEVLESRAAARSGSVVPAADAKR